MSSFRCLARCRPGMNTSPRIISRAVRSSEARATSAGFCALISSTTVNSPVGCCTENALRAPGGTCATRCATVPGVTAAVATVTAPSTPTAEWQSCGMKVRVVMWPPAVGLGATRHIFGTTFFVDVAELHRGTGLQADRLDALLQCGVGIELVAGLVSRHAEIGGEHDHHRHAVVDARHLHAVEAVDQIAGGKQRAAHRAGGVEKADVHGRGGAGHAVDARARPRIPRGPPGVCTSMSHSVPVFLVSTRSVVTSPRAATRPLSIANGTTAASMLPQLGVVSTSASRSRHLREQEFEIHAVLCPARRCPPCSSADPRRRYHRSGARRASP